jgi:hypothetical protein
MSENATNYDNIDEALRSNEGCCYGQQVIEGYVPAETPLRRWRPRSRLLPIPA